MGKITHPSVGNSLETNEWGQNHLIGGEDTSLVRTATYVVAASDAPTWVKAQADAVCDGTNDEIEIQTAIDTVETSGGGIVSLSAGTFNMSTTSPGAHITSDNISVIGSKGTKLTTSTNSYIFFKIGTSSSSGIPSAPTTLLSSDVAIRDTVISVTDASGLAAGDWILLNSTATGTAGEILGEVHMISSIVGNDITIFGYTWGSYTTANSGAVYKITYTSNISIENIEIEGSGATGSNYATLCYWGNNVKFNNLDIHDVGDGILLYSSIHTSLIGSVIHAVGRVGQGYGFMSGNASQWIEVDNNIFYDVKHGTDQGGTGNYGIPRFITISNNFYHDWRAGGFAAGGHYGDNIVYTGNIFTNGLSTGAIEVGAITTTIINNTFIGIPTNTIVPRQGDSQYVYIENNKFESCYSAVNYYSSSGGLQIIRVKGNIIRNCLTTGATIVIRNVGASDDVIIEVTNNIIDTCVGSGIHFATPTSTGIIQKMIVSGNYLSGITMYPILCQSTGGLVEVKDNAIMQSGTDDQYRAIHVAEPLVADISNNYIESAYHQAIYLLTPTNGALIANNIFNDIQATHAGIHGSIVLDTTANVTVIGNKEYGTTNTVSLRELTSASTNRIMGNDFQHTMTILGTDDVIKDNKTYITENHGVASNVTLDESGVGVIAHGCSNTPTYANVICQSDNLNVRVSSIDATNINILVKDLAGDVVTADTHDFYWEVK
jgi:hypothetical protein